MTPSILPSGMNSSAIYLFLLLQWLLEAPHTIEELQDYYLQHPWCGKSLSDDSIRIYLNTLRMLGCEIERPSGKNNFHYHLKGQPFSLQNPQDIASILLKQFNQLEPTTNISVIVQRYTAITAMLSYCGIPLTQWQQLKFPPLEAHSFVATSSNGVTLQQLVSYTQQAIQKTSSFRVEYLPPQYDDSTTHHALQQVSSSSSVVVWEVIPVGLLQERGRLYWICLEVPEQPATLGIERMLRYDRIQSIEPTEVTHCKQPLNLFVEGYRNALPQYHFVITCPVGINFMGLGFPQEWFALHSSEQFMSNRTEPPLQYLRYDYRVQTGLTFLLQQRLFAIPGIFTIIEAPNAFKQSVQQWFNETLKQYQTTLSSS